MSGGTRGDAAGLIVRREAPAQVRHVAVHDLMSAGRGALSPQVRYQTVERNDFVPVQQQHGEERTLPYAP